MEPCRNVAWSGIGTVGMLRGQGLAQDHGLVSDHGLLLEISGYLFISVIFHKSKF